MRFTFAAAMGAAAMLLPVTQSFAQSRPASAQPAQADDVKRGVEAWESGDYAAAVKLWRPMAIAGNADAQFNLAQAYRFGRSVPLDMKVAEDWYRKAAAQGHLQAEDNLALIMFQNARQNAMPLIQRSADRGDPRAQYVLATAMFNGDFVPKDWVTAYALMTRASSTGLAVASTSLAKMDKFIPLEQRQKGLALARDMELDSSRTKFSELEIDPPAPVAVKPSRQGAPAPVRTAPVPQSRAPLMTASRSALPPPRRNAVSMDRPTQGPKEVPAPLQEDFQDPDAGTASYETEPFEPAAPRPLPRPADAKPVSSKAVSLKSAPTKPKLSVPAKGTTRKGWRVQLGAFSDESRAKAQWSMLKNRVSGLGGLQPFLVKAASVTRLQVGPLTSRADADRVCKSAQAAGQSCFSVAP